MKFIPITIAIMLASQICKGQTQIEMNNEAINAHKKADQEMTKIYKSVISRLSSQNDKNQLLEAQRAWIKYKESHCKSLANQYQGGSIYPLVFYSCLEEVTIERKKQLQKYQDN